MREEYLTLAQRVVDVDGDKFVVDENLVKKDRAEELLKRGRSQANFDGHVTKNSQLNPTSPVPPALIDHLGASRSSCLGIGLGTL